MSDIRPLTSLINAKDYLNLGSADTAKDALVWQMALRATSAIEEAANRKFRNRAHTDYLSPERAGAQSLFLPQFPVNAFTGLYQDSDREFGASTEIDSDDFEYIPETGEIYYANGFAKGVRTVKAVYTAGYSAYEVIENSNDIIDWEDANGDQTATLTAGIYTETSLATHIAAVMNAAVASPEKTVVYNFQTGKFELSAASGTFILKFFNGDNAQQTVGRLLGFDPTINQSARNALNWSSWLVVTGSATTAVTTITFSSTSGRIEIETLDPYSSKKDNRLQVSFDGGTIYHVIRPISLRKWAPLSLDSIKVKASQDLGVNYQVAYTVESNVGTWRSDYSVIGVPDILENTCLRLIRLYYEESGQGQKSMIGYRSISDSAGGTTTFDKEAEESILKIIKPFRKRNV